jgi:hypothetical protein
MLDSGNWGLWHKMWAQLTTWLASHREISGAVIGALIWEILKSGPGWSGWGIRRLRNKLADFSVSRLRKRIGQMETYRNQFSLFASSDKALYLAVLQYVIAMLGLICLALLLLILEYAAEVGPWSGTTIVIGPRHGFAILSGIVLAMAFFVGIASTYLSRLTTSEAASKRVNELDSEIAGLKSKLDTRLRKGET